IILFLNSIFATSVLAELDANNHKGFDKGVSWNSIVPMKKVTFVNHDENNLIDDYSYLASVPSSVFFDEENNRIFSNPLLFYEDEYIFLNEKERSLNAYQGIEYFMEDWLSYSNNKLDQISLINIPKNEINSEWAAKEYIEISGENVFEIANNIALSEWSYSNNAVISVIEETFEKPNNITNGKLSGTINPSTGKISQHFEVPQTNELYPIYNEFYVPDEYKFMTVRSWYPSFYFEVGIPGFEGIINMSIPAGDRDLQIYCENEGEWMMAAITSEWNAQGGMDIDKTSAYVYKPGRWSVALTDVPTKSLDLTSFPSFNNLEETNLEVQKHRSFLTFNFGRYGKISDILKNMKNVIYQIDINMYPGIEIEIPENPPYGCRNVIFNLSWNDPSVDLGFSLIGPNGEEILSSREPGVPTKYESSIYDEGYILPPGIETDLNVERLGECLPGEKYKICVYSMSDLNNPIDFNIEYSWKQNISRLEGDCLASASEGAVLASILNCPLLYINTTEISKKTFDVLNELGIRNIYLLNLGNHLKNNVKNNLINFINIKNEFNEYSEIYSEIQSLSGCNDVIFTTIDPWTYWYVAELKPEGEKSGSRFIGPASYIAAHHGSPVIIIDNHPELSSSLVWHNELWRRHPNGHTKLPTVSEMYLTGTKVYDFLKKNNFDGEGDETIITVGGQFDIGLTWDRVFVGKGLPGRFIGSPTDISVWISKNVFYPMLIFENPALTNPMGLEMINGSSSERKFPWRGSLGLKITKTSEKEIFNYPILDTLVCYDHKFNSRASKYWGFEYKCADQTIPGRSQSFEPIDQGVMINVNGESGGYFADLSGSEVQPFYIKQGGYDPVFSTNFEANMYNLNQGVLLWMVNTHGAPLDGGMFMFWDVENENPYGYPPIPFAGYKKETNPWRGYEWLLGSTDEPDTMTSDINGVIAAIAGNPNPFGPRFLTTALDWALAKRPIRDIIGNIASLPILRSITPDWLQENEDYYDGVIITVLLGRFGTAWYNGSMIDDALGNIHSAGVSSVACLPAGKYLHLTLMRHGSPFQIMDPWATSWYSDVWQNGVPRGIALGETIGEIYSEGIKKVGIEYVSDDKPNWWWDLAENVCLYGDPNLRIWVPSTEFSANNNWGKKDIQPLRYDKEVGFEINGHNPFGATSHPNKIDESNFINIIYLVLIIIISLIIILFT
ncbi:hypothetical protein ACFL1L_04790, partial [Thermoplasmatota archaeon]